MYSVIYKWEIESSGQILLLVVPQQENTEVEGCHTCHIIHVTCDSYMQQGFFTHIVRSYMKKSFAPIFQRLVLLLNGELTALLYQIVRDFTYG